MLLLTDITVDTHQKSWQQAVIIMMALTYPSACVYDAKKHHNIHIINKSSILNSNRIFSCGWAVAPGNTFDSTRHMRYNATMQGKFFRIGTRSSELAVRQTRMVEHALRASHPDMQTQIVPIHTAGDDRTDIPLCEVNKATGTADKGVFVAAIEEALARGEIDCAVHSCKDMPGVIDERMQIAAVLPREVINDTLIIRRGANMNAPVIGTSSVRRRALVQAYWSGRAHAVQLRGNVTTRLRKLAESEQMDAIILARAGLNRLGESQSIVPNTVTLVDLDCDSFMPALCQGAIAVEVRRSDAATYELVRSINHESSELTVRAERAFLAALHADCSVPVGGYAKIQGPVLELRVLYFCPDGVALRHIQRGPVTDPESIGCAAANALRALM